MPIGVKRALSSLSVIRIHRLDSRVKSLLPTWLGATCQKLYLPVESERVDSSLSVIRIQTPVLRVVSFLPTRRRTPLVRNYKRPSALNGVFITYDYPDSSANSSGHFALSDVTKRVTCREL